MTKKERAEFDALLDKANTLAALRWTAPVAPDVPPPRTGSGSLGFTEGWTFNAHSMIVERAWSEAVSHGKGPYPGRSPYRSACQSGQSLYSTELMALAALRHALELSAASALKRVDARMAEARKREAAAAGADPQ